MAESGSEGDKDARPSGEAPVSDALRRACHELIDAASALVIDVDILVGARDFQVRAAVARDARLSIKRIVRITEALRAGRYPP